MLKINLSLSLDSENDFEFGVKFRLIKATTEYKLQYCFPH